MACLIIQKWDDGSMLHKEVHGNHKKDRKKGEEMETEEPTVGPKITQLFETYISDSRAYINFLYRTNANKRKKTVWKLEINKYVIHP